MGEKASQGPAGYLLEPIIIMYLTYKQKKGQIIYLTRKIAGRDDWIRTSDPLTPSQVRYQAAPRPEYVVASCATKNTLLKSV